MSKKLNGKVAYITGGGSGIGLSIVTLFAREGARVGIIERRAETAASVQSALGDLASSTAFAVADVGSEAAVAGAFDELTQKLGPAAILVNCAGIDLVARIEDVTLDAWNEMLRVHLTGTFLCCRRALPDMRKAGWGRIINVSSQLAHRGVEGMTPYCAAKAGIMGFTRALAYEAIGDGITVNCLNPGPIDTPLVASLPKDVVDAIVAQIPARRLGRPEEVAGAALLLATDEGGYFVGASMNMNGGHYMI